MKLLEIILFLFIMIVMLLVWWRKNNQKLRRKYIWIVLVTMMYELSVVHIFWINTAMKSSGEIWSAAILGLCIIMNGLILFFIQEMSEKLAMQDKLEEMYTNRQQEQQYLALAKANMKEVTAVREEYKNQIHEANRRLQQRESRERIKDSFDDSYAYLTKIKITKYCESNMINSILVTKKQRASQLDIQMAIQAQISAELQIEQLDICSLFCNLIDNAIEACGKISNPAQEKKIVIKIGEKSGYLFVNVENSVADGMNVDIIQASQLTDDTSPEIDAPENNHKVKRFTTKKDLQNHGYGLQLVRRIVEKYDGMFETSQTEQKIKCVVSLRL